MAPRVRPYEERHIAGHASGGLRAVAFASAAALVLAWTAMVPATAGATATAFPSKPIKIMAPANPGGGWDQLARIIQNTLAAEGIVSVPVEVFNRGGAGGTIGLADLVARHRGDAHVLMIGGSVLVGSELTHGSSFSLRDTTPLAVLLSEYLVIAVPSTSPYGSLHELLADFASEPERVTWGGGSAGGIDHILVGLLADQLGVDVSRIRYVAFPGGGDAAAAVMGGKVSAGVSGHAEWEGLTAGGRMRLLAVSAPERVGGLEVPTLIEQGLSVTLANWRGIFAAPGIRASERDWYVAALARLRESRRWQEVLGRNKWADTFLTGDELAEFMQDDYRSMGQVLGQLGLGAGGEGYAIVGPYVFPLAIAIGMGLSLFTALLARRRPSAVNQAKLSDGNLSRLPDSEDGGANLAGLPHWSKFAQSGSVTLAYILLLQPLGFL